MVETVLVPFDGSQMSERALEYVGREHPETAVHLLYVLDHVEASYEFDWTSLPGYWDNGSQEATDRGRAILDDAEEAAQRAGLTVAERELLVGRPATRIVEYGEEHDIHLIVMGTHGRQGLSRYILGSVTERVLRRSSVPVTVVR
ncbi:universal stress protein [Halorhabdus sp. CBA1104]|uniref:universal stress protein n=1 Tax=Halorhabdus sp. CBA1104 TaxID=1380432 RepID=UPI0012B3A411|nr:universal stress protein [Halorhabdus sp. CBA1104]QGN06966.1 universal stress protein [Halorhabdus sp. CBA1104]